MDVEEMTAAGSTVLREELEFTVRITDRLADAFAGLTPGALSALTNTTTFISILVNEFN